MNNTYRAKRIDNDHWVFGELINNEYITVIDKPIIESGYYGGVVIAEVRCYPIKPETIGKVTDIKCITSGVKICEGDICMNDTDEIGIVTYGGNGYILVYVPPFDWDAMEQYMGTLRGLVICANIHDNPNFIKEKQWRFYKK